jgi:hypothetical protein
MVCVSNHEAFARPDFSDLPLVYRACFATPALLRFLHCAFFAAFAPR